MNWDTPEAVAAMLVGIAKPTGLEMTEHRPIALQSENTDIERSESVNHPLGETA